MTLPEAQQLREQYIKIIGTRALSGNGVITDISIRQVAEGDYRPFANYFTGGSKPGSDPVELYKDRLSWGPLRIFKVYEPGEMPYSISAHGDTITDAGKPWMIGKTLAEVKPYLLEKNADVRE